MYNKGVGKPSVFIMGGTFMTEQKNIIGINYQAMADKLFSDFYIETKSEAKVFYAIAQIIKEEFPYLEENEEFQFWINEVFSDYFRNVDPYVDDSIDHPNMGYKEIINYFFYSNDIEEFKYEFAFEIQMRIDNGWFSRTKNDKEILTDSIPTEEELRMEAERQKWLFY